MKFRMRSAVPIREDGKHLLALPAPGKPTPAKRVRGK